MQHKYASVDVIWEWTVRSYIPIYTLSTKKQIVFSIILVGNNEIL